MILNCPKCNARFLVADSLIPAGGRTVRCGNCSNQWHVDKPAGDTGDFQQLLREADPMDNTPAEEFLRVRPSHGQSSAANVPALAPKQLPLKPFKIAVPVLALLWLVLALLTYFPGWVETPGLSSIYSIVGVHSTRGLIFADVKMEREDMEEGKVRFIVSGNIRNTAKVDRTVPIAKVTLNDEDNNPVWSRTYEVNELVKAGEAYPFHITDIETRRADAVKTITLDLGNSLELMTR